MEKSTNKKNHELLGMPYGTASNKLRKAIMFKFAQILNLDVCFQCGGKIEDVDSISIEHKESWRYAEDPVSAFFDLNNIAFSHFSCNAGAGHRPGKKYFSEQEVRESKNEWDRNYRKNLPKEEKQRRRKAQYLRTGK